MSSSANDGGGFEPHWVEDALIIGLKSGLPVRMTRQDWERHKGNLIGRLSEAIRSLDEGRGICVTQEMWERKKQAFLKKRGGS